MQLLDAGGVTVIGIDTREGPVKLVKEDFNLPAYQRDHPELEDLIAEQTGGHGSDAVIITAPSVLR